MFSINEIIDIAIQLEKNGERIYRNAINQSKIPRLKKLLEWVAEEESKHAKWFLQFREQVGTDESQHIMAEVSQSLVEDFIGDQAFSLKDVDFSKVKEPEELIGIFIEFEKDSILFYEFLKSFVQDEETSRQLDRIIEEEEAHIQEFEALNMPE